MNISDYHPTGREMEVLQFIKQEPNQRIQLADLYTKLGVTEYVLDKTLDNLVLTGHISEISNGVYVFEYDHCDTV